MATVEECTRALTALGERLADVDPDVRRRHVLDRSINCRVTDLDTTFSGRLRDGTLVDVTPAADPQAQIRLSLSSDELIALTEGRSNFALAWATGRIKVDASMLDLLKLRSLL